MRSQQPSILKNRARGSIKITSPPEHSRTRQKRRQRVLIRPSPSTIERVNSLMSIQSAIYAKFNKIVNSIDPLLFDEERIDLLVIEAVAYTRDLKELSEIEDRINELEQDNIELSLTHGKLKSIEPLIAEIHEAEEQLSKLKSEVFTERQKTIERQFSPGEIVNISKMKTLVEKQKLENQELEMRIESLEKRIALMNRKKTFIPNYDMTLITPRRINRMEYNLPHPSI